MSIPGLALVWGRAPSRFGSVQETPYWALPQRLHFGPTSLPPWPDETLAPRKQVQRQQARPRGGAMPVEAVSARLSPGPGWDQHRTDQPSLPPVTAERTPRLHPQQVGHQTARAAPRPQWLQSPEACQHGYPAPTMAGGVQRHQQTSGSLLTLGTALGNAHCHLTLHLPGGHLFQCGAGCNPQSQPGSQPCGVGRGTADQQLCQAWA
uniref:Uncharacterized protein n=1 Tax=Ursus americanus TaxID=9643 RepID=A0A452QZT4_URSAM